jgi:hypothetical protein
MTRSVFVLVAALVTSLSTVTLEVSDNTGKLFLINVKSIVAEGQTMDTAPPRPSRPERPSAAANHNPTAEDDEGQKSWSRVTPGGSCGPGGCSGGGGAPAGGGIGGGGCGAGGGCGGGGMGGGLLGTGGLLKKPGFIPSVIGGAALGAILARRNQGIPSLPPVQQPPTNGVPSNGGSNSSTGNQPPAVVSNPSTNPPAANPQPGSGSSSSSPTTQPGVGVAGITTVSHTSIDSF